MIMDARIVFLIDLILAAFFVPNTGQGVACDPFKCAENAECVDGQCSCRAGFVGYGRFICVPGNQCSCASFGDPHILQFDQGGRVNTVLPCQFSLAGFTTVSGCTVLVEIITYHRPVQKYPLRAFINMLKVRAVRDNTALEFTIGSSGLSPANPVGTTIPTLPDTIPGIDITVTGSTFDSYNRATLPECDNTVIAFDPTMLAAAIGAPRTSTFLNIGLCGNCNGNANDDNRFLTLPGVTLQEANMALSLRQLSIEQSTADSANCAAISAFAGACSTDATLVRAVRCCGVLYQSEFATCLVETTAVTREVLLQVTKDCLDWYCARNRVDVAGVFVTAMSMFGCAAPTNYVCV